MPEVGVESCEAGSVVLLGCWTLVWRVGTQGLRKGDALSELGLVFLEVCEKLTHCERNLMPIELGARVKWFVDLEEIGCLCCYR